MTDIVDFIRARLDEDEQTARAVFESAPGRWMVVPSELEPQDSVNVIISGSEDDDDWDEPSWAVLSDGGLGATTHAIGAHIARWDPARVLADVAAKRAAVEIATYALSRDAGYWTHRMPAALASAYVGHPDYQEGWRP